MRAAAADDRQQRAAAGARRAEVTTSNLGLGNDVRAGLTDLSAEQKDAVRQTVCHLLAGQFRDVIPYGAGWTDRERQQPVGDSGRSEPRQADAIAAAELERALADPDPLHAIAQLVTGGPPRSWSTRTASREPPRWASTAWPDDSPTRCPTATAHSVSRSGP